MDLNQTNKALPSVLASNTGGETRLFESRGGKRRTNKKKGGGWFSSGPSQECVDLATKYKKYGLNMLESSTFKQNCDQNLLYQGGKKRSTKKKRTNKKKGGKSRRVRRSCF